MGEGARRAGEGAAEAAELKYKAKSIKRKSKNNSKIKPPCFPTLSHKRERGFIEQPPSQ